MVKNRRNPRIPRLARVVVRSRSQCRFEVRRNIWADRWNELPGLVQTVPPMPLVKRRIKDDQRNLIGLFGVTITRSFAAEGSGSVFVESRSLRLKGTWLAGTNKRRASLVPFRVRPLRDPPALAKPWPTRFSSRAHSRDRRHLLTVAKRVIRIVYLALSFSSSSLLSASSSSFDGTFARASFAAAATSGSGSLANRS
jgi:hypothetical protein